MKLKQNPAFNVHSCVRNISPLLLAAALLLLAAGPATSADEPESVGAAFTATLDFNSTELNSPRKIPQIEFGGRILIDGRRIRVDVVNSITQEPSVALLDIEAGTAALLYPDNLNGESMPLGDDFRSSYLGLFHDFALGKPLGEVKGWKLATSKLETGATQYLYSGETERSVTFTLGPGKAERLLVIASPKLTVRISLSDIEPGIEPGPDEFSVPAGYAMRKSDTRLADILPSL